MNISRSSLLRPKPGLVNRLHVRPSRRRAQHRQVWTSAESPVCSSNCEACSGGAAVFTNGQALPCDLVVAGIGAQPALEFLNGSGLEVNNGVVVNEYLETAVSGIFAAGDIANYPDPLFAKRRRVEHWDNAVSQGQHCAHALLGERAPFKHVSYFFSDVFDLSYELWGDTASADQVVYRGDHMKSFSVWWLKAGKVVAAFVMNRPDEERESAPKAIEAQQLVDAAKLADEATPVGSAAR